MRFEKRADIDKVRMTILHDQRENFVGAQERHESDLCDTCQGTMLATYFRVPAHGRLVVPDFIEPTRAERARADAAVA
jgi:hypothetical protein